MAQKQEEFQPGALLHAVLVGVFRARGTTYDRWCKANGVTQGNPRLIPSSRPFQRSGRAPVRLLDGSAPAPAPTPDAKVVKPVFGGKAKAATPDATLKAVQDGIAIDLAARRAPVEEVESDRDIFRRWLELDRAIAAGSPTTPDQRRWHASYQQTPGYRTQRMFWDDLGDALFSG